jgi:hypothetical protein
MVHPAPTPPSPDNIDSGKSTLRRRRVLPNSDDFSDLALRLLTAREPPNLPLPHHLSMLGTIYAHSRSCDLRPLERRCLWVSRDGVFSVSVCRQVLGLSSRRCYTPRRPRISRTQRRGFAMSFAERENSRDQSLGAHSWEGGRFGHPGHRERAATGGRNIRCTDAAELPSRRCGGTRARRSPSTCARAQNTR